MTIGVQGGWGTGKTSLMKLIDIGFDQQVIKVWINTWQYAQVYDRGELPLWVIAGLVRGLEKQVADTPRLGRVLKSLGWAAKVFAESKLGFKIDLDEAAKSEMDKLDGSTIVEGIHAAFGKAVKAICEEGEFKRVVFFIDDLDRIAPPVAVSILEAIKTFLDVPGCVFFLAIDFEIVVRGLQDRKGVEGREFFEKIIQVPFHLQHHTTSYETYLIKHLAAIDGVSEAELAGWELETLFELTTRMNPRAIKRAFNLYSLLKEISGEIANDTTSRKLMLAMTCLQVSSHYLPVFQALHAAKAPAVVLGLMRGERKGSKQLSDVQTQAQSVWDKEHGRIRDAASMGGRSEEEVADDLRGIAEFIIGIIDGNDDGKLSPQEVQVFRQVLDLSAATTESSGPARNRIVSFSDLREEGLVPAEGDQKLVFRNDSGLSQGKKVYMIFGGKQHRVAPSMAGGKRGEEYSLREITKDYLKLNYTPSDYARYWILESTDECLSDLIAKYRAKAEG